jgi:hypothetical protein
MISKEVKIMSNKQQLQTNNTNLDALITRVNAAKDTAASLPEASSGGDTSSITGFHLLIGDDITSIGDSAFRGCSSLTSITIPNSVTSIGYWAFYGCNNLTSVIYNGTIAQWNTITKSNFGVSIYIQCTDGKVYISSSNPESGGSES